MGLYKIRDSDLKEYIHKGGEIFNVVDVHYYRSSGILKIETSKDIFFYTKDGFDFFSDKDLNQKVQDDLFVQYLKSGISSYTKRLQNKVNRLRGFYT